MAAPDSGARSVHRVKGFRRGKNPKARNDMDDDKNIPLGRRRLILRTGALGVAGLGAAGCVPAQPVYVQQPPVVVRGTGLTDADPSDGPGNGRGGSRVIRGTGITDSDPSDGPGNGRGGYRGGGYRTGITDSDPNDGPGRGRGGYRGGYRTGLTDSDPSDGPGRGRRGY